MANDDELMRKLKKLEYLALDQSHRIATLELAVRGLIRDTGERHAQLLMRMNTPIEWPDSLRDVLNTPPKKP